VCGRETGGSEAVVSSVDIGSLDVSTPDPEDAAEDPVVAAHVGTDGDPRVDPAPPHGEPGLASGASYTDSVGAAADGGESPPGLALGSIATAGSVASSSIIS